MSQREDKLDQHGLSQTRQEWETNKRAKIISDTKYKRKNEEQTSG